MTKHIMVVFTNAKPGREDEFNAWYSDRHLNEVLQMKGFDAAQRFELEDIDPDQEAPYRYLAIYEVDGDSEVARRSLAEAREARDAEGNPVDAFLYSSDAKEPERELWWYRSITERRTAGA